MISNLDLCVLGLYLVVMLLIGIKVSRGGSLDDFMVNRRNTRTALLAFTIVSTSVGGGTTVGLVAMGYEGGIVGTLLGLSFVMGLLLMALVAPLVKKFGDRYNCYTLPDFLAHRYTSSCRLVGAVINLIIFFFFMAAQFVALGTFVALVTGWSLGTSIFLAGAVLVIYTSIGGLKSVFYTDFVQFWILFVMLVVFLFPLTVKTGGGLSALQQLPPRYFTGTAYGIIFIVGAFLFLGPSLLVAMDMWQRIFAAKDMKTARRSMILSALLILPFFVFFPLIGMFAKVILPQIDPNMASARLVVLVLPSGVLGLCLAGFMAALMSTADSMLIVASVILAHDGYKAYINPLVSEKKLLVIVRATTFLVGFLGLLVAYLRPHIVDLLVSAFSSLAILIPAVILGLIWKRGTSKAAVLSMSVGFIVTIGLSFVMPKTAFVPGIFLSFILYFIVSLLTNHNNEENIYLLQELRAG